MRAVLSWLREYSDVKAGLKEICDALTNSGSKVEFYETEAAEIKNVIVARIERIRRHPHADRLQVCEVRCRPEDTPRDFLQVVTAATNIREGDLVPLALDGAVLAGAKSIHKGELRGEASEGMFCSVTELGYKAEDFPGAIEDGIFILPRDRVIGSDIHTALQLDESMIEFEITSNRPDCLSMEGLGRELAVTFRRPFHPLQPRVMGKDPRPTSDFIRVVNEAPAACPSYRARVVTDVRVEPSPFWLQKRLRCAGVRPISNIVDITNYVMLELGQPMHAFDLEDIKGGEIHIRHAKMGEAIRTLDGVDRKLDAADLVIANTEQAMAVAGVMGAENSEIKPGTRTLVFESANFDPVSVLRTSKRLGLRSEASARFDKGLDPSNTQRALDRACELVEQLGCGRVTREAVSVAGVWTAPKAIAWSAGGIQRFLGARIPETFMEEIFRALGCEWAEGPDGDSGDGGLRARPVAEAAGTPRWLLPPSWRHDLESEADLAEEVARFYGYNRIPATLLEKKSFTRGGLNREQKLDEAIADICVGFSFYEAMSYSFESPKVDDLLLRPENDPLRRHVELRHTAEDMRCMRNSMLPSMLKLAANNAKRWVREAALFELGRCYEATEKADELPLERRVLAAVYYNQEEKRQSGAAYYRLKGLAVAIFRRLGIDQLTWERESGVPALNPYRTARISCGGELLGRVGYVLPDVLRSFAAPMLTAYLELDLDRLYARANLSRSQKALHKHPPLSRDLAFTVDREREAADLENLIRQYGGAILDELELFDVYQGAQVGPGRKSLAYRLRFRSPDRTLTDSEVNAVMETIVQKLAESYSAEVRT